MSLKESIKNVRRKLKKKDWVEFNEKLLKQEFLKYQEGNQFSILEAIQICALSDIKLLDWVAEGYLDSYGKFKKLEAGSLDDAFGFKFPKNTNIKRLQNAKKNARLRLPVFYASVQAHYDHDAPLKRNTKKKSAFEYAAEQYPVSEGKAEILYGEVNKMLPELKELLRPKK
jgi:hypothetical protein